MENLVTRPIEKQLKGISGAKVKKIQSTSQQDFSLIIVEFDTDVKTEIAKQKVKDAVDKARTDLPNDLTQQPNVQEFDFSEMPIMYVNVSGDYDAITLKKYAEKMQDKFEELTEINRADIVGAPVREIQINVDPFKMQAAKLSFNDIGNAINYENRDISGGLVEVGNMKRSIRVKGQFTSAFDLQNIIVNNLQGGPIYLRDVAQIIDTVKETESYARLDGRNVVTLNIVKRSGENLIEAATKVSNWYNVHAFKFNTTSPTDLLYNSHPLYAEYSTRVLYPFLSVPFVKFFGVPGMLVVPALSLLTLMLLVARIGIMQNKRLITLIVLFCISSSTTIMRWMLSNTTDALLVAIFSVAGFILVKRVSKSYWYIALAY